MIRSPGNLNEVCHWYECDDHDQHSCGYCAEEDNPMNKIGSEEIVRFTLGREVTGLELDKHTAGATLTKLARQHAARKNISFQDALHEIVPIVPGEMKDYLGYELTDISRLMPRGGGSSTQILFRASEGWSEAGVQDWIEEQGFKGGTLTSTTEGWTYIPERFVNAFPR